MGDSGAAELSDVVASDRTRRASVAGAMATRTVTMTRSATGGRRRADSPCRHPTRGIWGVIAASSAGTVIEWYDFYIFGSLAAVISRRSSSRRPTRRSRCSSGWRRSPSGFAVRPFGALVFGRIGDLVGRKYAFLVTLLIMGGSTAAIGLLPGYAHARHLRARSCSSRCGCCRARARRRIRRRGGLRRRARARQQARLLHSFIQTTATLGLFVSLDRDSR